MRLQVCSQAIGQIHVRLPSSVGSNGGTITSFDPRLKDINRCSCARRITWQSGWLQPELGTLNSREGTGLHANQADTWCILVLLRGCSRGFNGVPLYADGAYCGYAR